MPKKEEKKERMVSMYDPSVDAYRDVPESLARKFLESAEEIREQLEEADEE